MALGVGLNVTRGRTAFLDLAIEAGRMDDALKASVRKLATKYRAEVIRLLSQPGGGKQYRRTRGGYKVIRKRVELFGGRKATIRTTQRQAASGAVYRASAPGQPPAQFTGNLLRGVRTKYPSKGKGYTAITFSNRKLAAHRHLLEFGTSQRTQPTKGGKSRNVGRVAPRPVWSPLSSKAFAELEAEVLTALRQVAR
jgi:hypothetical protein